MDDWQNVVKWSIAAHLLLVGGGLLMLVLVAGMLRQRRNPATSAAWLMFMLVLPYIGVPLYLLFGTRKLAGLKQRKSHLFMADSAPREPPSDPVQRYLQSMHVPPPVAADAIRFHTGAGEARRALLDVLHGAHQSLDVCVFILANDAFGREVLAILSERARDGVQVRLLLDGFDPFCCPSGACARCCRPEGGSPGLSRYCTARGVGVPTCVTTASWRLPMDGGSGLVGATLPPIISMRKPTPIGTT